MANVRWHGGYVSDVPYVAFASNTLLPVYFDFAFLMQGRRPIGGRRLRYLELGCGQGVSACHVAVLHPDSDVVGVDFNPSCVGNARALAEAAGLPNARFLERDFRDLNNTDFCPEFAEFDIIVAHGVWTWVGADARDQIVRFVQRRLRSQGAFYVSYNTPVQWGPILPLQRLMTSYAQIFTGSSDGKVKVSLEMLNSLNKSGLKYFNDHPYAKSWLEGLAANSEDGGNIYRAHEYLNQSWALWMFSDVENALADAKLEFVGSVSLVDNIFPLSVPDVFRPLFTSVPSTAFQENLKDLIASRQFRRDLFAKGGFGINADQVIEYFADLTFSSLSLGKQKEYRFKLFSGDFTADKAFCDKLVDACGKGKVINGKVLVTSLIGQNYNLPDILQMLALLINGGVVEVGYGGARGDEYRHRGEAFNKYVYDQSRYSDMYQHMVAVEAGVMYTIQFTHRYLLHLLLTRGLKTAGELKSELLRHLVRVGAEIKRADGSVAASDAQKQQQMGIIYEEFVRDFSDYVALGIVSDDAVKPPRA